MTAAARLARLNAKALRRFGAEHVLDGLPVQGDFIRPGKTFTLGDGMAMVARVPTLVVADGDVPAAPVGKTATCEETDYTVQEVLPDGFGFTVLELEKVPS